MNTKGKLASKGHVKNARCLGFLISVGSFKLYTAGDLPDSVENKLCDAFEAHNVKATVMKLSHHGSNTSTPQRLLSLLQPQAIVSSHGTYHTNTFGHPNLDVVDRAFEACARNNLTYIVFTNPLNAGCIKGRLTNCPV